MENDQYYVFNPNDPLASPRPKIKRDKHLVLGFVFIGAALILLIGLVAGAYFLKIWPFANYDYAALINKAMEKLPTIETLTYDFSINLKSAAKDANSKTFVFSDPEYDALLSVYQRDGIRLLNTKDIISQLKTHQFLNKKYPKTLVEAEINLQDPSGQPYQYSSDGKTFLLTVVFETEEGVNKASYYDRVTKNEKAVIFSENSYGPYSSNLAPPKPYLIGWYDELIGLVNNLPGHFSFTGSTSGSLQKNNAGTLKMGISVNYEDLILSVEGESLVKNNEVYLKLNSFPGLPFINLSGIKEKWIKFTKDNWNNISSYEYIPSEISEKQDEVDSLSEQLKVIGRIAKQSEIIQITGEPAKEVIDKEKVYHYQFKLAKEKLASFYQNVTNALQLKFQDKAVIKFNQEIFNSLNSQSTLSFVDYTNQQYLIDIYLSKKTGYPIKASFSLTLVPEDGAKNENVAVLSLVLNLKDINKDINIDTPKESMSMEDAYLLIMGISKEDYLLDKQESNIYNLKHDIFDFRNMAGKYPDFLDQLKLSRGEIKKMDTSNSEPSDDLVYPVGTSPDETPLVKYIPQDVYTKQAYGYEKTADDNYKLTYQMSIPAYKPGTKLPYIIYKSGSKGLIYASGFNTANKTDISLEAKAQNIIDSDKDGLSDAFEAYLGTDPKNKDTDKDGYPDGEELKMNYDPLTTGMLQ
ncbi:MAG: hypothetical protein WC309_04705 [Candidatus Paceibacterota bacterium]|jgi:hypothetical protein